MAKSVALLLGVHAHQPVGNFQEVVTDAHVRCYGPFLRTLYRYPEFHFAIHVSGWLLDTLLERYPEDMHLLREMVERGQAELFGGGYTEPVLASISARDRVGQILALSRRLGRTLGQEPAGAWLTERVWESTVVPSLGDAGIRYVTVDDYHFLCTGKDASSLNGFYTTEEDGRQLDLFPISEALRYRLPFSPAREVVAYLESLADESGQAAAVYFDDIEKFGIWPETYAWVYEKGWLNTFIEGVLDSSLIRPTRYSDYHAASHTRGVVYLPTASYSEMNEWTLPVPAAHHYADMVEREKREERWEISKPFVRGGIWRNFFMRFPESNWMHKRMLALSARYHALPESAQSRDMLRVLYEAQANDAYWHGLFGGLYLPHLRRAVYRALVQLEALLDQVQPRPARLVQDLDLDGHGELFLHNDSVQVVIALEGSASIREFDAYALRHNFCDTLARQTEHYHRKVHAEPDQSHAGSGIANPHERAVSKHEIHPSDLATDSAPRTLLRESWAPETGIAWISVHYGVPGGKGTVATFEGHAGPFGVTKKITLKEKQLRAVYYATEGLADGVFRVALDLAMPSCDGPAGRYRVDGQVPGGFGQTLTLKSARELVLEDEVLGGRVRLASNVPALLHAMPHFSVSQSEAGFEKIMQSVSLTLDWPCSALKGDLQLDISIE